MVRIRGKAMYCRNCGQPLNPKADYCIKCGVGVGKGNEYCPECGAKVSEIADVCIRCGTSLSRPSPKSKVVAGLLGIFLGWLGIHNFYLGYIGKGIAQLLLTVLSLGFLLWVAELWGLIEGILILTGSINRDKKGNQIE